MSWYSYSPPAPMAPASWVRERQQAHDENSPSVTRTAISGQSATSYLSPAKDKVGKKPVGHKYDRRSPPSAMQMAPATAAQRAPEEASPEKKKKRPDELPPAGQMPVTRRYDPTADHVGNVFAGKRTGFTPDPVDRSARHTDDDGVSPAGVRVRDAVPVSSRRALADVRQEDHVSGLMDMGYAAERHDDEPTPRAPSGPGAGQMPVTRRYDPTADHVGNVFAGKRTGFTPDPVDRSARHTDDDGVSPAGVRVRDAVPVSSRRALADKRPSDSVSGLVDMGHTAQQWGDAEAPVVDTSRSHHALTRSKAAGRGMSERTPRGVGPSARAPSGPAAGVAPC